jgi:hypothetical protein
VQVVADAETENGQVERPQMRGIAPAAPVEGVADEGGQESPAAISSPTPTSAPIPVPASKPSREEPITIGAARKQLWEHGYPPVALRSHTDPDPRKAGKAPIAHEWTREARKNPPPDARGIPPNPKATNTGIATHGLRAVDIDCGDADRAAAIRKAATDLLGKTIIRTRSNSPRCLLVYRAANGEPGKITLTGATHSDNPKRPDQVEVLGAGQQFAALGVHVSGAKLEWNNGGPLDTPRGQLPTVTEEQIRQFLDAVAPLIGADTAAAASGGGGRRAAGATPLGPRPTHATGGAGINANAAANLDPQGFEALSAEFQNQIIKEALERPEIAALTDADYETWRNIVWSVAHGGYLGATEAYDLAHRFSELTTAHTFNAREFNQIWHGYDPHHPKPITIGTLLDRLKKVGIDLGKAFAKARAGGSGALGGNGAGPGKGNGGGHVGPTGGVPPPPIAPTGVPPVGPVPGAPGGPAASSPPPPIGPGGVPPVPGGPHPIASPPPPQFTENALAAIFSRRHAATLGYVHEWGRWMRWGSDRWHEDHVTAFDRIRTICAEQAAVAERVLKKPKPTMTAINRGSCVRAVEQMARHHAAQVIPSERFDSDPMLLNTPDTAAEL